MANRRQLEILDVVPDLNKAGLHDDLLRGAKLVGAKPARANARRPLKIARFDSTTRLSEGLKWITARSAAKTASKTASNAAANEKATRRTTTKRRRP